MSWEQRLREMIFAGGALTGTACGGSAAAQADASATTTPNEAFTPGDDGSSNDAAFTVGCCNADPDPCCPMLQCLGPNGPGNGVGPNDPTYLSCEARYQCEDFMNGIYTREPDGSLVCVPRGIVVDASTTSTDSGRDAGPEAATGADAADTSATDAAGAGGE